MAEEIAKGAGMAGKTKYIIGGLVIVVIVLAVANYMYMKKLKALQDKPATTTNASLGTAEIERREARLAEKLEDPVIPVAPSKTKGV